MTFENWTLSRTNQEQSSKRSRVMRELLFVYFDWLGSPEILKCRIQRLTKFTLFFMQSEITEIHIGKLIRKKLREQGRTVTWFAAQIPCTRKHAYRIFNNPNINTELLIRISAILDYNFFEYYVG